MLIGKELGFFSVCECIHSMVYRRRSHAATLRATQLKTKKMKKNKG